MKKRLAIMGKGWLGSAFYERWKSEGGSIHYSTRNKVCDHHHSFYVNLSEEGFDCSDPEFFKVDVLVIAFPPFRSVNADLFPSVIQQFCRFLNEISFQGKIIYISSTSVYPSKEEEFTESYSFLPEEDSPLLQSEKWLMEFFPGKITVLRCGGLIGEGRDPGRFLAGKKNVAGKNASVNLVHRDDVVEVIKQVLEQDYFGEVLNVVGEPFPSREIFYTNAALRLHLEPPQFSDEELPDRKISNRKLRQRLNFEFKYPHPELIQSF